MRNAAGNGSVPRFSLIEIMVGLAIGLASMLAIYQLYATSEGRRRTIVSISEAQTAGSMALFAIERDIRSAGLGFASIDARYLNCSVKAYNSGRSTAAFDFRCYLCASQTGGSGC
jgi:type IV pilus assembly protein PilW